MLLVFVAILFPIYRLLHIVAGLKLADLLRCADVGIFEGVLAREIHLPRFCTYINKSATIRKLGAAKQLFSIVGYLMEFNFSFSITLPCG